LSDAPYRPLADLRVKRHSNALHPNTPRTPHATEFAGAPYHVMVRGNARPAIFARMTIARRS
jgi:glycine cleavage system regulatory protein